MSSISYLQTVLNLQTDAEKELMLLDKRYPFQGVATYQGRVWCAIKVIGHLADTVLKPIEYCIAALAVAIFERKAIAALNRLGGGAMAIYTQPCLAFKALLGIFKPEAYFREATATSATHAIGATYATDGKGIIDYAYANAGLGFGYVVDFMGHNKPDLGPQISPFFKAFNEELESALLRSKRVFETLDEAKAFLQCYLDSLARSIRESHALASYAPAFAFAQVVTVKDQKYLLTAGLSDTTLLVRIDGNWQALTSKASDYGLGGATARGATALAPVMCYPTPLQPGDEIFGFTDGIGEYLTDAHVRGLCAANRNRSTLINEFVHTIQEIGKQPDKFVEGKIPANNSGYLKLHKPDDARHHDDVGLFTLQV